MAERHGRETQVIKILMALGVLATAISFPALSHAQARTATVCAAKTYIAGESQPLTIGTDGDLCVHLAGSVTVTGGGDASAANQTSQITQETAINTVLGTATASPTANTISDRLKTIATNTGAATPAGPNAIGAVIPYAVTSTNGSTTIATGNTFQTLLALNAARKGCFIQNPPDATENLYVSVAIATGSATKAKSVQLTPGSSFGCAAGGNVITDNIAVTAVTSAHAFVEIDQ